MTSSSSRPRRALPSPGTLVPLVTPVGSDGGADLDSLRSLIDFVLGAGCDGVLVLGSSGEAAGFGNDERLVIAAAAIEHVGDRGHVMVGVPPAGVGDQTATAVLMDAVGADSLLLTAPVGLGLAALELERHFRRLAERLRTPIVAYEVPVRVITSFDVDVIARLAADGVIAGLKDSSGNLPKGRMFATATAGVDGFRRYTGTETSVDSELAAGYDGSIPGIGNVFPDFSAAITQRFAAGDRAGATAVQNAVVELLGLFFYPLAGGGPTSAFLATVKSALVELGVIADPAATFPITPPDAGAADHARRYLARAAELRTDLSL